MKKYIIAGLIAAFPVVTNALEVPKVTLSGTLDTQLGVTHQKPYFRNNVTYEGGVVTNNGKLNNFALVNSTKVYVKFDGESDYFKYGAMIKFNADTSQAKNGSKEIADKTMMYIQGVLGKFEAGSATSVADQMDVSAVKIARATGGIDGDAKYWINKYSFDGQDTNIYDTKNTSDVFLSTPYLPYDCECSGRVKRVSYFSPDFSGFRLGLGFIPDTQVKGTVSEANGKVKAGPGAVGYRNLYEAALYYEVLAQDVNFKTSIAYQGGEAKKNYYYMKDRYDMNSWLVSAQISYNGFSIAGSYSDWGKTGTQKNIATGLKRGAKFWTLGAAYEKDNLGLSVTYFESKRAGGQLFGENGPRLDNNNNNTFSQDMKYNKLQLISAGIDYKLAPGLMPYAEVTHFNHNRSGVALSNKGEVYLTGITLSF